MERFQRLKSEINEGENSIKNQAVPPVELNQHFASFSKVSPFGQGFDSYLQSYLKLEICYHADKTEWIERGGLAN